MSKLEKATPMMQQYLRVKNENSDCLLFFRMGDFYELFFEDAIMASPILEVALTKRGKTDSQNIPMCGVPHHSVDLYIKKLINNGLKVAICDQLETPEDAKKRDGHKAVVKRGITRIITPGTITEDNLLQSKKSNYLFAISCIDNNYISIAWADISTLEFKSTTCRPEEVQSHISRLSPSEILMPESIALGELKELYAANKKTIATFQDSFFSYKKCHDKLLTNFNLKSLKSLGSFKQSQICACGSLIEYVCITQKQTQVILSYPENQNSLNNLLIDYSTLNNLELFHSNNRNGKSLIQTIDSTITPSGSRLLKQYISSPLANTQEINARLELVEFFYKNSSIREEIRKTLKFSKDLMRSVSKILFNRGNPANLYEILSTTQCANKLSSILLDSENTITKSLSQDLLFGEKISAYLSNFLIEKELHINNEDFIKPEFNSELAALYEVRDNSQKLIDDIKNEYIELTGIQNLKILHNNVLGYYIEVTKSNLSKVTSDEFIHRQTMINSTRYVSNRLKNIESQILNAKVKIEQIEQELFNKAASIIEKDFDSLKRTAQAIANLDVITSLAEIAQKNNFCRPFVDNSNAFEIIDGRHPVVEHSLSKASKSDFIPNDCKLEKAQKLWLVTGPNMAGKSTFLRQNAIITILAQIGSFVPAKKAKIGVVDKLFCRVGAGDDLSQGHSTFLVEMIETASILNQATDKSLVILDEVGRGTSTYDGLAIAWSCLQYIHNKINSRTLFATHYHELTSLSTTLNSMKCFTVEVKEWEEKIIFLHKVSPGIADRSYGINVAELAGIPKEVISQAKKTLHDLHDKNRKNAAPTITSPDLFEYQEQKTFGKSQDIFDIIQDININETTPVEAMQTLIKIKKLIDS